MNQKFSLKDHLFNREKIEYLSRLITQTYPSFKSSSFIQEVCEKFPEQELKQRIEHIQNSLKVYLPDNFPKAIEILLRSLPAECDPNKTDDDFGDFIFSPYSEYVAKYGCTKKYLSLSFAALEEITKRFSVEWAIRPFLEKFPDETIIQIQKWTHHTHYHVRRLASEGIRPHLPWGKKIDIPFSTIIAVLNNLYDDNTRFVTRSVANTLNDISKKKPDIVLTSLQKWKTAEKQSSTEMDFIIKHATRTLVKKGHHQTLIFLGFSPNPKVVTTQLKLKNSSVLVGESLQFSFSVTAEQDENLIIDYSLSFPDASGKPHPKVFKIKNVFLHKGEKIHIEKKHPLRIMTTKKLYPGEYLLKIIINGKISCEEKFTLFYEYP